MYVNRSLYIYYFINFILYSFLNITIILFKKNIRMIFFKHKEAFLFYFILFNYTLPKGGPQPDIRSSGPTLGGRISSLPPTINQPDHAGLLKRPMPL
ncbi:hypothetical protein Hanom_Chr00s103803g01804951 [Helianthus anomalus]